MEPDRRRRPREVDPEVHEATPSENEDVPIHERVWRAYLRGAVWDAMADKWGVTEEYAATVCEHWRNGHPEKAAAVPVCKYSRVTRQVWQSFNRRWVAVVTHNPHDRTFPRIGSFATEEEALRARDAAIAEGRMRTM